ncbi:MAG: T9SS type A sorting domain-containing protein [Bacteroidia bacterium]|nr:T9SS type A sorting domain-containing protein [Bacteroidia bacterium]MCF8427995.1 T9SS type A sorting domain-containing protein [Bacteroidia bacterium]MCF8445719.1 T9SS type A sorting domain-containing protein [Bacteroidia bacterium]
MNTFSRNLSLAFLLFVETAMAQTPQFLNNGFENWEIKTANSVPYNDPSNWYSLNSLKQFGFDEGTTKSTDAHSGQYSVMLESIENIFGDIPGLLSINYMMDATGAPDFSLNKIAFTGRPSALTFWFKSLPESGDYSALVMLLTKWNPNTQIGDTIGYVAWENSDLVDTFTFANLPLTYLSNEAPDSVYFIASSSKDGFNPLPGSRMWLDDLILNYTPTGIKETPEVTKISVYPNPIKDKVNISGLNTFIKIILLDQSGREIKINLDQDHSIDTKELKEGIYFLTIQSETNLQTIKLIKY